MNELTLLREAGPEAPPLTPAARAAARAALLDEIAGHAPARRRRRTAVRAGLALAAVAAAWTTAVVVAAPDELGPPPGSVALVAFEPPAFPFALDPAPAGLAPSFSADPGDVRIAVYRSPDESQGVTLRVTPDEPDLGDTSAEREVTVGGRDAEVLTEEVVHGDGDVREREVVLVEWDDDRWVEISGRGRYGDRDELMDVAAALVERPQPVPLQVHLAPAGWSVLAYKDDRVLTLVNDAHEQQTVTVFLPEEAIPAERLLDELMGPVGPVVDVAVGGRPAQLVRIGGGPLEAGWYLQAQFGDGTTFVVQAPEAFTREQVLQFAAQVTWTP
ncbi:hypothetical protein ACI8AF_09310 [Blastococcus sp. SYSU D00669]